jgi:hypothetical protein
MQASWVVLMDPGCGQPLEANKTCQSPCIRTLPLPRSSLFHVRAGWPEQLPVCPVQHTLGGDPEGPLL